MNSAEFASRTNSYLTEYVKFADAKAGAVLTFTAVVGAVVSATAERVLTAARTAGWGAFLVGAVAGVAVAASVTMTLWHTINALSPKMDPATESLHSFPDIARKQLDAYTREVNELDPNGCTENIAKHNYTIAKILLSKFDSIAKALFFLRIAVLGAFGIAMLYACTSASAGAEPKQTKPEKHAMVCVESGP